MGINYSTAVALINKNVRAVKAVYEPNGGSEIFKTLDASLKKDDLVVVATNTRHGFTVVKIVDDKAEFDFDSNSKIGWVVDRVNIPGYEALIEQENEAIAVIKAAEDRKKREDLMRNVVDAVGAGEIKGLKIANIGGNPSIEHKGKKG